MSSGTSYPTWFGVCDGRLLYSNERSVHREIGICMSITFLLPLMWARMNAQWEKISPPPPPLPCLSPLRLKRKTETHRWNSSTPTALLQYKVEKVWNKKDERVCVTEVMLGWRSRSSWQPSIFPFLPATRLLSSAISPPHPS